MLGYFLRLIGKECSPQEIEVEFEKARTNYLEDLAKLRAKYATEFLTLSNRYKKACMQK